MARSSPDVTSKSRIYRQIRRSIISGEHRPGERLDLDALTRAHGTSVTPVRDALQMLSQEGLVTIRPRSGYYVTHVTLKKLRDMLELREILEEAAIKRLKALGIPHIALQKFWASDEFITDFVKAHPTKFHTSIRRC